MKRRLFLQGLLGASAISITGTSIGKTKTSDKVIVKESKNSLDSEYIRTIVDYDIGRDAYFMQVDARTDLEMFMVNEYFFDGEYTNKKKRDGLEYYLVNKLDLLLSKNNVSYSDLILQQYPSGYEHPKFPIGIHRHSNIILTPEEVARDTFKILEYNLRKIHNKS
jgi:hypothetical protein